GKFSGCIFSKLNSGIFAPFPDVNNVIPTATVPITKIAPKIGYILPIILSIGKIADKKKYRNIMTKIIHKAILLSNKTGIKDPDVVAKADPTNKRNNKENALTQSLENLPQHLPAISGICAPIFRIDI